MLGEGRSRRESRDTRGSSNGWVEVGICRPRQGIDAFFKEWQLRERQEKKTRRERDAEVMCWQHRVGCGSFGGEEEEERERERNVKRIGK